MPPILFETSLPLSQVFAVLGTTIGIAIGSALLACAIGTFMALLMFLSGHRAHAGWVGLLLLPLIWPPFQTAIGWMVLQGESGITLFQRESFEAWGLALLFSPIGVILVHVASYWPIAALMTWWGLSRTDRAMVDQLRIEGISILRSSVFLCRLNLIPILVSGLLVLVLSLGEIGAPEMLQVNTFLVLLYTELNLLRTLEPVLRMSAPLFLFLAIGILSWSSFRGKIRIEMETYETPQWTERWIPPFWAQLFLLALLIAGPGTVLLTELVQVARDSSTIHLALLTECLSASVWTGLGAVFLVGVLLQVGFLISTNRGARLTIDAVSFLLFAIPAPVLALSMLEVCTSLGGFAISLLDSFWILSLSCAIRFFWVAWVLVQSGEERISLSLQDRIRSEGLKPHQRLWYILIPLLRPQAMVGLFFVWALSVGEITLSRILQPPGIQTLAARTVNFMHWGHDGMVALGLLSVALLEFFPVLVYLGWKGVRSTSE